MSVQNKQRVLTPYKGLYEATNIKCQPVPIQKVHVVCLRAQFYSLSTVMILSFRTPKTFVVITLKFELCGSTID